MFFAHPIHDAFLVMHDLPEEPPIGPLGTSCSMYRTWGLALIARTAPAVDNVAANV